MHCKLSDLNLLFWLTDKYGEGPYCRMGWVKASVDNIHIYVKYPLDDFQHVILSMKNFIFCNLCWVWHLHAISQLLIIMNILRCVIRTQFPVCQFIILAGGSQE